MHTLYPSSTERMSGATCPYTELLVVSGSNTSSNSNSTVTSPPPIPGSFRTICDQHHQAMTSWSYKQARNRQAREPVQLSLCWMVESGEPAGADHTRHARGCGRTAARPTAGGCGRRRGCCLVAPAGSVAVSTYTHDPRCAASATHAQKPGAPSQYCAGGVAPCTPLGIWCGRWRVRPPPT